MDPSIFRKDFEKRYKDKRISNFLYEGFMSGSYSAYDILNYNKYNHYNRIKAKKIYYICG
jgi:ATP-dependent protease Clp ATPase subunit